MKRKIYWGLLMLEAAVCIVVSVMQVVRLDALTSVLAFPYEPLGNMLWALSVSGTLGNLIAIILYAAFSLLPVGYLLFIRKKRQWFQEDWLLVLASGMLFFVLYMMVNPGLLPSVLGIMAKSGMGKGFLGGILTSIFVGYFVLRALRYFREADGGKLAGYMTALLSILNFVFVFIICGGLFYHLVSGLSSLGGTSILGNNTGSQSGVVLSGFFLVLQFCVNALPYALDILVVTFGLRLLNAFMEDPFSEQTSIAGKGLSRICVNALIATVLATIGLNLLQLLFVSNLLVVNGSLVIPVFSLAFVLAALLLSNLLSQTKTLKDENDLYI